MVKVLSRDKIQRMIGARGGSAGSGGGTSMAGYASMGWVEDNYLSKEFFNRLFTIHGETTDEDTQETTEVVVEPNDTDTDVLSVEAMFGFWTEQYISALGQNEEEPGTVTALSDLIDVELTSPSDGQALVYDSTLGKWVNGDVGSGSGTVTSIMSGDGITFGTNTPITSTGTISIDTTWMNSHYLPLAGGVSMANTNLITNLNADLLDGHNSDYFATAESLGNYLPLAGGVSMANTNLITNLNADLLDGHHASEFALLDENGKVSAALLADEAVKLQTARTIWGQSFDGTANITDDLTINNNKALMFKDTSSTAQNVMSLNSSDNLVIGWGVRSTSDTYIAGSTIQLAYSGNVGLYLNNSGYVGIGLTNPSFKLHVDGYTRTSRLYLTDSIYFEYDNSKYGVRLHGAGFYADTYVSALGTGGPGTAVVLNNLVSSLNDSSLNPLSYTNKVLVNNGGTWSFEDYGGGGSGSVTSITAGTGITFGTNAPITSTGTISIDTTWMSNNYLPKTGGTISNNLSIQIEGIDLMEADNGLSSTQYKGFRTYDVNGYLLSQYISVTDTSGNNGFWISARNHPAGDASTEYEGGIGLTITKAGEYTWNVSYPARFRAGIGVNNITIWGQTLDYTNNISGNLTIDNNRALMFKNTSATAQNILSLNSSNNLVMGWDVRSTSDTFITGKTVNIAYGGNTGIYLNASGNVGIGTQSIGYKLVVNGDVSATNFRGALIGNASSATTAGTCTGNAATATTAGSCTGNAATATKLATARTIWGQSFDGSANITDDLTINNNKSLKFKNTSSTAQGVFSLNSSNNLVIGWDVRSTSDTFITGKTVNLAYKGTTGIYLNNSGNVGIGTDSPGYKLEVSGNICGNHFYMPDGYPRTISFGNSYYIKKVSGYFVVTVAGYDKLNFKSDKLYSTVQIHSAVGVLSDGYVTALSDIRKKDVQERFTLKVEDIAHSSLIKFTWKDREDKTVQAGGIAQEWQKLLPEAVITGSDGTLSMDYGVLALASAVSVARKVNEHEERIRQLERENENLRQKILFLENRR